MGVTIESQEFSHYMSALQHIETVSLRSQSLSHPRQLILTVSAEVVSGFISSPLLSGTVRATFQRDCGELCSAVHRVTALANLHRDFKRVLDMGFLYHHIEVLSPLIRAVYQQVRVSVVRVL